ncbi:MAG: hypothetical protein BGO98_40605 [Myxococcales bacterium 68-20]|nr:hypothetical protein [Myxococcales bacterium]OJY19776.1 MAG: hypothetical protein BGO98_40605 [Myxococcales bacterium 68-20]
MRASFILAFGPVALALALAAVACAASGDDKDETTPRPDADGGETVIPDGGTLEADAAEEAAVVDGPKCSQAGWCVTSLPDPDLLMKDIWPLSGRALSVAESPTLGVKVLEWTDAEAKWRYIDDGTQNESGLGRFVGKLWMPNENELYYGVSPGYVVHGTRPVPPATAWSWTRHRLANSSTSVDPDDGNPSYWRLNNGSRYPALGVWGTSRDDVYAWFKNTIFHWTSLDGGAPEWVAEYVASDTSGPMEQLHILGAAGTSADDVWFSGGRAGSFAGCAILVRKTAAGYKRVADGAIGSFNMPCTARAGVPLIGGIDGWLTDIQALAPNELVALKGARDVVRISADEDSYSVALAPVPTTAASAGLNSLSVEGGNLWLGGMGVVLRGTGVFDGGAYEVSTVSLTGAPLGRPIYQVRGTSNTNLWAIGVRYALHKTTP